MVGRPASLPSRRTVICFLADFQDAFLSYVKKSETNAENFPSSDNSEASVEERFGEDAQSEVVTEATSTRRAASPAASVSTRLSAQKESKGNNVFSSKVRFANKISTKRQGNVNPTFQQPGTFSAGIDARSGIAMILSVATRGQTDNYPRDLQTLRQKTQAGSVFRCDFFAVNAGKRCKSDLKARKTSMNFCA